MQHQFAYYNIINVTRGFSSLMCWTTWYSTYNFIILSFSRIAHWFPMSVLRSHRCDRKYFLYTYLINYNNKSQPSTRAMYRKRFEWDSWKFVWNYTIGWIIVLYLSSISECWLFSKSNLLALIQMCAIGNQMQSNALNLFTFPFFELRCNIKTSLNTATFLLSLMNMLFMDSKPKQSIFGHKKCLLLICITQHGSYCIYRLSMALAKRSFSSGNSAPLSISIYLSLSISLLFVVSTFFFIERKCRNAMPDIELNRL